MSTQTLVTKLLSYDTQPSQQVNTDHIIKNILKNRLKQIDELKTLCLDRINKEDPHLSEVIHSAFLLLNEMRSEELKVIEEVKQSPNTQSLYRYINLLSSQRKLEALEILKVTKCLQEIN
jgi:hypothetical protein